MKKITFICMCGLLLGACAADTTIPDMSAENLYQKAYKLFEKTDYEGAAKYFDEVERQHPYSVWAPRSQIMMAYSFYKKNLYEDAVLALDRFIQLHPGNKNAPYAYYLKGLCYFEQISDIAREQQMTQEAKQTFSDLIARYPHSIYVSDAQSKLVLIEDQLAGKEMAVGRYYLKQKEYLPALSRFQIVVQNYSHTNQVNEAYYRMAACYLSLGLIDETRKISDKLRKMYPNTKWTRKTEALVKKYSSEVKAKR
ncbi:MAG: outer membrane protein assembly factor BamD [Alphaproteobacteria bacterium]|nr:outer membrane protein assembly factor BamD [Alphaproteobacteria bacterium]